AGLRAGGAVVPVGSRSGSSERAATDRGGLMPREQNPDELGALWEKTGNRGIYMTGTVNGQPVVLFKNDRKAPGSKQPDWRVLEAKPKSYRQPTEDETGW